MSKYKHYCSEWDGMFIDELNLLEISCCTCFPNDKEFIQLREEILNELELLYMKGIE